MNRNDTDLLKQHSVSLTSLTLTSFQLSDLELLLNGGFAPLTGYMDSEAYRSVIDKMRLPSGNLWPMPVALDVFRSDAEKVELHKQVALRDAEGVLLAILTVTSIWEPDKQEEAHALFGTDDPRNPGVARLYQKGEVYVGGILAGVELPKHYDFPELRRSPKELAGLLKTGPDQKGRVLGFQTEDLIHRREYELTLKAAQEVKAHLLISAVVGSNSGNINGKNNIDDYGRVRCLKKVLPFYPSGLATLNLLPLARRMTRVRESLWSALIHKNYGCSHFILDHLATEGLVPDSSSALEAEGLLARYSNEIGIEVISFGKEKSPSEEFSFPEVISEFQKIRPPRETMGVTLFFTGLSGAGKSTIAKALAARLMAEGERKVTLLDGDVLRTFLSSELGFSKEHRSLNVRRIGFVAGEITKHGGIAICCPIAPYGADRKANRDWISQFGAYIEIYLSTSIQECERRDRKGLYAKARKGLLKQFTGIDDPYEPPIDAEVQLNTEGMSVEKSVQQIVNYLRSEGYLKSVESEPAVVRVGSSRRG